MADEREVRAAMRATVAGATDNAVPRAPGKRARSVPAGHAAVPVPWFAPRAPESSRRVRHLRNSGRNEQFLSPFEGAIHLNGVILSEPGGRGRGAALPSPG
ncbi:hypothetical protein GCM10010359_35300 [Streptomyces morookaense]|nr:hypothetical protein GCM10010359_35300 [Streptomyces morookaense]